MAGKGGLTGFRDEDAGRRTFTTRYYNEEIHRAAFATPPFFREMLGNLG